MGSVHIVCAVFANIYIYACFVCVCAPNCDSLPVRGECASKSYRLFTDSTGTFSLLLLSAHPFHNLSSLRRYERLLVDVIRGNQLHFVRRYERILSALLTIPMKHTRMYIFTQVHHNIIVTRNVSHFHTHIHTHKHTLTHTFTQATPSLRV